MTPVETAEIESLARSAGYSVVDTITQPGHPDSGSYLGTGRLEDLAETVASSEASTVVVDDRLTPGQHHAIESMLPDETSVLDRYRLVLDIFEAGASSHRANLQVELAQLRYDLPRLVAASDEGMFNRFTESGTPVYDVRDRISRLERRLAELPDPAEQFRERRREEGFDLVTIAGYTNAGKSTLLHRLADELSFEPSESADIVDDEPTDGSNKHATASVADRLFETLETTTRRATIGGRPVLVTDTVGYVDELPHDLVASFSATLSEAAAADVVVLVVDASDGLQTVEERLQVSLDVLAEQGVDPDRVVTALNKIDRLEAGEREDRIALAKEAGLDPILVSVREGTNLDALRERIEVYLPTERLHLEMPAGDDAMALISRAYDRTAVQDVTYRDETVVLECTGRPAVLEQLRGAADRA
ncbi:GTPase HflX [Natronosalvus halobius]|nr:GTPase HflX [Natronosalvus halobius]USZ73354.1 GTPase HflX [Natronosalvus halobius]